MSANIISLNEYKSTIRSRRNGVAFPTIYRASGFYHQEGSDEPGEKGPTFYTLTKEDDRGYSNVTYEAIRGFSETDTGWLILRHHPNRDNVEGYLDALSDLSTGEDPGGQTVFQTKQGLFSLLHREALPGCPDKLVVYVTRASDPNVSHPVFDKFSNGWLDHHQIVHVDGSITEDPDVLLPLVGEEV